MGVGALRVAVVILVTAVLALLGWWLAGRWFAPTAAPAVAGHSYLLVARSNCRYPSAHCTLENGTFKLELTVEGGSVLRIHSSHRLDGLWVALAPGGEPAPDPVSLVRTDGDNQWQLALPRPPDSRDRFYVAARAERTLWFGDASTAFQSQ